MRMMLKKEKAGWPFMPNSDQTFLQSFYNHYENDYERRMRMMLKKKKIAWPFMPISDQSERFRARRLRPPRPRILLPCEDDFDDLDCDEEEENDFEI